jgi:hypothetical protein
MNSAPEEILDLDKLSVLLSSSISVFLLLSRPDLSAPLSTLIMNTTQLRSMLIDKLHGEETA